MTREKPGMTEANPYGESLGGEAISWQTLFQHWQNTLAQLAQDFYSGKAEVDPKNPEVCTHCQLHSLCRIHVNRP
jgi:hypothetical protein